MIEMVSEREIMKSENENKNKFRQICPSHDVKSRLYSAKSLLEAYVEQIQKGGWVCNPLEMAEQVLAQITHVLDVISRLNRIGENHGSHRPAPDSVRIQDVVPMIEEMVVCVLSNESVTVENAVNPTTPPVAMNVGDLTEILINLLINACHAMPNGGDIRITSAFDQEQVIMLIQDSGVGMDSKMLKHIFEPFQSTDGKAGNGLGLYIVRRLVEQVGGAVLVRSQPDRGTTFTLTFPRAA